MEFEELFTSQPPPLFEEVPLQEETPGKAFLCSSDFEMNVLESESGSVFDNSFEGDSEGQEAAKSRFSECKICHKMLSQGAMRTHINDVHIPTKVHFCYVHSYVVGQAPNMRKHIKSQHPNINTSYETRIITQKGSRCKVLFLVSAQPDSHLPKKVRKKHVRRAKKAIELKYSNFFYRQ